MPTIWFNQGYAVVRDALLLIRDGAAAAGVANLCLLASHADPLASVLEAADQPFAEPLLEYETAAGRAGYAAWCAATCRARDVDLFMVQGGQRAVAEHLHLFPATTHVVLPAPAETLALVDDKAAFTRAAAAAGLPTAWSAEVATAADLDAACVELAARGLPGCVKPREGVFGSGFWRLDDGVSLFEALIGGGGRRIAPAALRAAIAASPVPVRLLAMEYLAGPEWSLDCVCDEGRLVVGVARRKRGRVQELEVDGPIFAIARAAVDLFGLTGLVNVQLKAADLTGDDPRLLEINPRMSGGVARSRFAGVNLPWRNLAALLGVASDEVDVPVGGALVAPHETGTTLGSSAPDPLLDAVEA